MRGSGHDRGQTTSSPPGFIVILAAAIGVVIMDSIFNASSGILPSADTILGLIAGGFVSVIGGATVNIVVAEEWTHRFRLPGP